MPTTTTRLTAAELRAALSYDPESGEFFWRVRRKRRNLAKQAGAITCGRIQYRQICIDGRLYRAHRLAFLWMTGRWPLTKEVDHVNGDGLDNRWSNLRPATNQQNQANRVQRMKKKKNTPQGVQWLSRDGVYRAQIKVNYRPITLGYFDTPEQAHAAYAAAAKKHFGAYARLS